MKRGLVFLGLIVLAAHVACADEIVINTSSGEVFVMDIDPTVSVAELQQKIAQLSGGDEEPFFVGFSEETDVRHWCQKSAHTPGGYMGYPRNYTSDLTHEEKSDIRLIVTSLANKSLISIAVWKGDLEAAGDRIEHIHPLRFLMTVFSDEELKVGIRNIRARGWVWGHFISGIKEALATEMGIGNLKDEFVYHFAQTIKVDPKIILPAIHAQQWEAFIDLLIAHIPRVGDHDRYDN